MLSTDVVSMPKPRKSRALRNTTYNLPVRKRPPEHIPAASLFDERFFWSDFQAVLTSGSALISGLP